MAVLVNVLVNVLWDNVNYYGQKGDILFVIIDIRVAKAYNYACARERCRKPKKRGCVNRIVNQIVN